MASEESNSDEFLSGDDSGSKTDRLADKLLGKKPEYNNRKKCNITNSMNLKLQKLLNTEPAKKSGRIGSKKQIDDLWRDLYWSFTVLTDKFHKAINYIMELTSKIAEIEQQIDEVVEDVARLKSEKSSSQTYASVVSAPIPQVPPNNDRLDRLEFPSSEDERKKRSLDVKVYHPDLKRPEKRRHHHTEK